VPLPPCQVFAVAQSLKTRLSELSRGTQLPSQFPEGRTQWGAIARGGRHSLPDKSYQSRKSPASKKQRGEVAGTPFGSGESPREFQIASGSRVAC
jgi:hypothetical protein